METANWSIKGQAITYQMSQSGVGVGLFIQDDSSEHQLTKIRKTHFVVHNFV